MKMRDLAELKIHRYSAEPHVPPTDEMIAEYERHFGLKLPESYVQFLRYANGGGPELDLFDPRDGGAGSSVNVFFALDDHRDEPENLWRETASWREGGLGDREIPIANDGAGNIFYIDLDASPPCVGIWDHEEDGGTYFELAPSFEDFINGLEFDEEIAELERR